MAQQFVELTTSVVNRMIVLLQKSLKGKEERLPCVGVSILATFIRIIFDGGDY